MIQKHVPDLESTAASQVWLPAGTSTLTTLKLGTAGGPTTSADNVVPTTYVRLGSIAPSWASVACAYELWSVYAVFAAVNGTLVFAARDENGCELWRSDGVTADLLMDINPGSASSLWRRFAVVAPFRSVSGLVLFSAYDDAHGFELWATDGTSTTGMVEDIAVGAGWSSPSFFTPVGSLVFFTANDHVRGTELWAISRSAIHRALNLPEPKAGP